MKYTVDFSNQEKKKEAQEKEDDNLDLIFENAIIELENRKQSFDFERMNAFKGMFNLIMELASINGSVFEYTCDEITREKHIKYMCDDLFFLVGPNEDMLQLLKYANSVEVSIKKDKIIFDVFFA